MLSEAIRLMRERFKEDVSNADQTGVLLALQAFEMEARNMEERIEYLTGRPHAALDGRLIAGPVIDIGSMPEPAHV